MYVRAAALTQPAPGERYVDDVRHTEWTQDGSCGGFQTSIGLEEVPFEMRAAGPGKRKAPQQVATNSKLKT